MIRRLAYQSACLLGLLAGQAGAVALEHCTRTTHVTHGGEAQHRDLGEGRVMWTVWWSHEGIAKDLFLADCSGGETLSARTAEENMSARLPFDKTDAALQIITAEHQAARVFATLERIAGTLGDVGRDIMITRVDTENCACAALYPDLRGTKQAFVLPHAGDKP